MLLQREDVMKQYVMDIETDGLLDDVTTVHLMICKDADTGQLYIARGHSEVKYLLEKIKSDHLIGHNILGYDLEVLRKLFNWTIPIKQVTDTLILSRLMFPDLRDRDHKKRKLDAKLHGSHSLKAWGERFDFFKGDYGEQEGAWDQYTDEMKEYCKRDVDLTEKLWRSIDVTGQERALELEHEIAAICYNQERYGFPFDTAKAVKLYGVLVDRRQSLHSELRSAFGSWVLDEGPRKKGLYHKINIVQFNPSSRQHIAKRLKELRGWIPKDFTATGEPKVDEKILSSLSYPEAKLMSEYLMIQKRIGQLAEGAQAWLKLEKKGRIHGRVNTMGAVTSRCTHSFPNTAQVPSIKAPYGVECRTLFKADPGFSLLGCDVSGLELRCLAHYMAHYDGGAYGKELLHGDIHTVNQEAAGLPTRDAAKTFIYALCYGAGDEKIGSILGKGPSIGKKVKNSFLKKMPALKSLRDAVKSKAEQGYLRGLDGRVIPIRSSHAALNTLFQSAGAILCKRWVVELHKLLKDRGYIYAKDYAQVAFVHDEVQLLVRDEHVRDIGELAVQAIGIAGDTYNFRIPLTGEWTSGRNWAETH
tara:strand:- start:2015 stop:3772 length:1758 start_codon:yes stop_codon:yes gene_type:complete